MGQRRAALVMALAFCSAVSIVGVTSAQIPLPAAKPPEGAALFKQQCALCHTTNASDPPRQGPTLFNIVGREAGTAEGFSMIPGAIMPYRQARSELRIAIVSYLKELH